MGQQWQKKEGRGGERRREEERREERRGKKGRARRKGKKGYLFGVVKASHQSLGVLLNMSIGVLSGMVFLRQHRDKLEVDSNDGRAGPGIIL